MTFDEFIEWYPENKEQRYELHHGELVKRPEPTGSHSKLAGKLAAQFNFEIVREGHSWFVPRECVVKPVNEASGYEPDVIVLDEAQVATEPRWNKSSMGRTWAELEAIAQGKQEQREQKEERAKQRARKKYLDSLVPRVDELGTEAFRLMALKTARGYEQAVAILVDLKEVAIAQGNVLEFMERLQENQARYWGRPALKRRMQDANLLD